MPLLLHILPQTPATFFLFILSAFSFIKNILVLERESHDISYIHPLFSLKKFISRLPKFISKYSKIITRSDPNRAPTFKRGPYQSTIDYFMLDVSSWDKLEDMAVCTRVESDHVPLVLSLRIATTLVNLEAGYFLDGVLQPSNNRRKVQ